MRRGGLIGLNPKTEPLGLGFGESNVGGGDLGVGYTEVEVGV